MILKVFSIYDKASKVYNQPFFMLTKAEAIRAFAHMANDSNTDIGRHTLDFSLHMLGTYDNNTGFINQDTEIEKIGTAEDYRNVEEEKENLKCVQ